MSGNPQQTAASWRSARELFEAARDASSEEVLQAELSEIARCFPRLAHNLLALVLVGHGRRHPNTPPKWGLGLADALDLLRESGFPVDATTAAGYIGTVAQHFRNQVACAKKKRKSAADSEAEQPLVLRLCDFRLVLKFWRELHADLQKWFGVEFLAYWQSLAGFTELSQEAGAESSLGRLVDEFRALWEPVEPTIAQKLSPDRAAACLAHFGTERFEKFLNTHVDLQGDCTTLVADLRKVGGLTAEVVRKHEGLIAACAEVEPEWLSTKMLAGDISLATSARPQASLVLRLVKNLEQHLTKSQPEGLTVPQLETLSVFLCSQPVSTLAPRSNMMIQALPALMSLCLQVCSSVGQRKVDGKKVMLKVTEYFIDTSTKTSRIATVPNTGQENLICSGLRRSEGKVASLPAMLDLLLDFPHLLPAERWLTHVATFDVQKVSEGALVPALGAPVVSDRLRRKFSDWVLQQLRVRGQRSATLGKLFGNWVVPLCTTEQVLEIWRAMTLEAMDSWFVFQDTWLQLLARVPEDPHSTPLAAAMYDTASEVLRRIAPSRARELDVLRRQARLLPERFVQERGVATYLELRRRDATGDAALPVVERESHVAAQSMAEINDSLHPAAAFRALLESDASRSMARTKTAEEFATLKRWVKEVCDTALAEETENQRSLERFLCLVWGDALAAKVLCGDFVDRILALQTAAGAAAPLDGLARFAEACPHLGDGAAARTAFLLRHVRSFVSSLSGKAATAPLTAATRFGPLIAAHAASVEDVVAFLHALGVPDVEDAATEAQFWRLLEHTGNCPDKPRPQFEQLKVLRSCKFGLRAWRADLERGDCVESDSAVWDEMATTSCAGGKPTKEAELDPERACAAAATAQSPLTVFRKFGPRGEQVVAAFLRKAEPQQLLELFSGDTDGQAKGFRSLCSPLVLEGWQLGTCPPKQEKALMELLTEHFPTLWSRHARLVWEALDRRSEDAEVDRGAEQSVVEAAAQKQEALDQEALVKRLLRGQAANLDALPRRWWHCVDFAKVDEAGVRQLAAAGELRGVQRTVKAGPATFGEKRFPLFALSTQMQLLRNHWEDLLVLTAYTPQVSGPIMDALVQIFRVLDAEVEARSPALQRSGDGVTPEGKLASGWNRRLNVLLTGLRKRVSSAANDVPNWLHSEEQRLLFDYCASSWLNPSNGAVLADLLESKHVDPLHVASAVSFVLSKGAFEDGAHRQVRDAALRAMVRLSPVERDVVIAQLLGIEAGRSNAGSVKRLPVYALFTICVANLASETLVDGVCRQLDMLNEEQWQGMGSLMRDANPVGKDYVHTYPRSKKLQQRFVEVFLGRYLRGDSADAPAGPWTRVGGKQADPKKEEAKFVEWHKLRKKRDPRFFRLFLAVCEPAKVPLYLLDVLDRQLHPFPDPLFLQALAEPAAFENKNRELFASFLEHTSVKALVGQVGWICARIRAAADTSLEVEGESKAGPWDLVRDDSVDSCGPLSAPACQMLSGLLDLLRKPPFRHQACAVLEKVIDWGDEGAKPVVGALLQVPGVPEQLWAFLIHSGVVCSAAPAGRMLWIKFYIRLWTVEQASRIDAEEEEEEEEAACIARRREELLRALPECLPTGKAPLTKEEVKALGVDIAACKLLVELSPQLALRVHGRTIVQREPIFARGLSDDDFNILAFNYLRVNIADWKDYPWIRSVAAAVEPKRGLPLALELLQRTGEQGDLQLLRQTYLACDRLTRRQVRLVEELSKLWEKLGEQIQTEIVDAQDGGGTTWEFDASRLDLVG